LIGRKLQPASGLVKVTRYANSAYVEFSQICLRIARTTIGASTTQGDTSAFVFWDTPPKYVLIA
jgi:hypothetical protein